MTDVGISVLLVTYNHEAYLERAIASIESQVTSHVVEVVVVDDSSSDGTLAIVAEWAARSKFDVRVLDKTERLGITRNYARGFAKCRGTYIAVLEGDDEWLAVDKLERQSAVLEANPRLALVANRVLLYDEDTGGSRVIPMIGRDAFLTEVSDQQLADTNWFATFSCCMYRSEVLRSLDPAVFETTAYDWLVNLAVMAHGNAGFLPEVMTLYRQHSNGEWSQKKQIDRDTHLQALIPEYIRLLGPRVAKELTRAGRLVEERLRETSVDDQHGTVATADRSVALPIPRVTSTVAPRVSVVMAVYNHGRYILEAVNSVLDQTAGDLELVIVDDGSHDDSMLAIATVDDPRVRVYQLGANQGAAAALNIAIQQTRSRLIAVINSDDAWEPTKLERQLAVLEEHPEVGAVFTAVRLVGPDSKPLPPDELPVWNAVFRQRNRSQGAWLRRFFEEGNCLCHPSVLIRREYYETYGLMDNRMRQIPDLLQWITLVKHYPIIVLGDEELVRFRLLPEEMNASSTSQANVVRGVREHFEINEHFFDDCPDDVLIDAFGDVMRDPLFHTPAERAATIAFLWLDVLCAMHGLNRVQGLRELRRLLADPTVSPLLLTRYQFTDLTLHGLSRLPDDLPAAEHAQWLASDGLAERSSALAFAPSGEMLRIILRRMKRAGFRNWPRRALVGLRIARGRRNV